MMYLSKALRETASCFLGGLSRRAYVSQAPGRVEVLGNHTDYNGGLVLASTIDRFVWTIGAKAESVNIRSLNFNEEMDFNLEDLQPEISIDWKNYVKGVFWAARRRQHEISEMKAIIDGNVPVGAGLSSSAALEVSVINLIAQLSGLSISQKSLAMLAFEAERIFCGVSCGIMDQFTSQLCNPNSLLAIHCVTMQTQDVQMPKHMRLIIADSMVRRTAGDVLNQRREECRQALSLLQQEDWEIRNLSQIDPTRIDQAESLLPDPIAKRVRHIVDENKRVKAGIEFLSNSDVNAFGRLMYESHESSRDLYEVSHPRLDILVEIFKKLEGVRGSRLTGAGFGGAVIALSDENSVDNIIAKVKQHYENETGDLPEVYSCSIPGGVQVYPFEMK